MPRESLSEVFAAELQKTAWCVIYAALAIAGSALYASLVITDKYWMVSPIGLVIYFYFIYKAASIETSSPQRIEKIKNGHPPQKI